MWFNKKKKVNARVRFQQTAFKKQLKNAQLYKRTVRVASNPDQSRLGRWFARVPVTWMLLVIGLSGLMVYVTFIPNFLFVRSVVVTGASMEVQAKVESQIWNYVSHNYINLFPQKNLLLLQKKPLQEFLLATNSDIYEITKIHKKYWHSLQVDIVPRTPAFLLQSPHGSFIVSNDGIVVTKLLGPVGTSLLLAVQTSAQDEVVVNGRYFPQLLLQVLSAVRRNIEDIPLHIRLVELMPVYTAQNRGSEAAAEARLQTLPSRDIIVYTEKDPQGVYAPFRIILDIQSNIADTFARLQLLLSQQSADRLKNLSYIDMRFKQKGFVCLQNAPCAQQPLVEQPVLAPPPPAPNAVPVPS